MPIIKEKPTVSHVVKVTGMSGELLELLDLRVRQQHAAGRAEYIRELIRRDVLASQTLAPVSPEQSLVQEYHTLVDLELESRLTPVQQGRLREVEYVMNRAEQNNPETRRMFERLEETASKLDQLLSAVRELPKAAG